LNQSPIAQMSSRNDLSRKTSGTPLGAIGRGLVAGAVGTLAMDLLLHRRYRRGGGKQHFFAWEFPSGLSSWDEARVPGQVGLGLEDRKQVTNQVTTASGNGRPGETSSDATPGLACANRTQRDALRRNRAAWHAEGQGFESP
jgi:hypothetical protein